jgi:hypothetical protein
MDEQDRHETFDETEDESTEFWWIDAPGNPDYIEVFRVPDAQPLDVADVFFRSWCGLGIRLWDEPSPEDLKEQLQLLLTWIDEGGLSAK